jgi:hypothetical protein
MKSNHSLFGQRTLAIASCLSGILVAFTLLGLSSGIAMAQDQEKGYTKSFPYQDCDWKSEGENRYFILRPGYQLVFEGVEDGKNILFVHKVLDLTRKFFLPGFGWVETRVVEELEWADGKPVEFTRGFFAIDAKTSDLYDFGDEVDIYNDAGTAVESNAGTWHAGEPDENGFAWPGIFMPGSFLLGAKYYQQMAEGKSEERGENWEMGLTVKTPAGTFNNCVRVRETNWSEPEGAETFKTHAPGIGLIGEDTLELIAYGYDIFDDKTGKLKGQYKGKIATLK